MPNDIYYKTTPALFRAALEVAQSVDHRIAMATTPAASLALGRADSAYVASDGLSGFAVRADGELVGVYSRVAGRGDALVASAIRRGARTLDHFSGFLDGFYEAHGFVVVRREPNWTTGQPDIVFRQYVERGC
jgi:hypothetical protein